jgi:hypothetical protein
LSSFSGSSADVLSSNTATLGIMRKQRANAILCCSPRLRMLAQSKTSSKLDNRWSKSDKPAITSNRCSSLSDSRSWDGYATFCLKERGHMYGRCVRKHSPARPTAGTFMRPSAGHRPAITRRTELFPQPLGPMRRTLPGILRLSCVTSSRGEYGTRTQMFESETSAESSKSSKWAPVAGCTAVSRDPDRRSSNWRWRCSTRAPQPNAAERGPAVVKIVASLKKLLARIGL